MSVANHEIDKLIAEHVMGWRDCQIERTRNSYQPPVGDECSKLWYTVSGIPPGYNARYPIDNYSSRLEDAIKVVEAIQKEIPDFFLGRHTVKGKTVWWCVYSGGENSFMDKGDSPEEAICKAALRKCGVNYEKNHDDPDPHIQLKTS